MPLKTWVFDGVTGGAKGYILNLLPHPPNSPERNALRRVLFWSPLCTYARRVLSGSGRVGGAAEPLGQNELKDTDQDLIFVCRTLPARKRDNGPEAVYPSKRLTHTQESHKRN